MVEVSVRDMGTTALGEPVSMPILIAPTAFQGLAHPEREVATVKAAAFELWNPNSGLESMFPGKGSKSLSALSKGC